MKSTGNAAADCAHGEFLVRTVRDVKKVRGQGRLVWHSTGQVLWPDVGQMFSQKGGEDIRVKRLT